MLQMARNVTDAEEGFSPGEKYLLMDRDGKFSEAFRTTLEHAARPGLQPNVTRRRIWSAP
jgi:hypothetical protein